MKILIRPKKLTGTINVVPSKSYSHRAIIAASLAEGESVITNLIFSEDIKRTIEACCELGAQIITYSDYIVVRGTGSILRNTGKMNAGESGSTIRFMIPIMLVNACEMEFYGQNHLNKRPLDSYFEIFKENNIEYTHPADSYLPLKTKGGLKPGEYYIKGDISSQFITGLLFALPLLDGESVINITSKLESKSYIDLTLDILKKFGINIINENYEKFIIGGNQKYIPCNYEVEGDFSQAAFFLAMGALGNNISLGCMNLDSLQGDRKIIEDLEKLGTKISYEDNLLKATNSLLKGSIIDLSQSPDLGPVLSVVAALAKGESKFINASRLRIKECDRITCVKEELNKLGALVSESADELYFTGVDSFNGSLELHSHNDHRIAMSLAVASTMCSEPIMIDCAESVKKSYPHFWDDFKKLGGDFDVFN